MAVLSFRVMGNRFLVPDCRTNALKGGEAELRRNIYYMRDVELHEGLFTAFAFHPRSIGPDISMVFRSDCRRDDGISSYNEALAARSNGPS